MESYVNKQKITFNGLPVYRSEEIKEGKVKYVLFEDNEETSSVIFITGDNDRESEYSIILKEIRALLFSKETASGDVSIRVSVEDYEQSKRDKQWLQKPITI